MIALSNPSGRSLRTKPLSSGSGMDFLIVLIRQYQ